MRSVPGRPTGPRARPQRGIRGGVATALGRDRPALCVGGVRGSQVKGPAQRRVRIQESKPDAGLGSPVPFCCCLGALTGPAPS